ncbi:PREDICTED: uncharacterized protein LOC105556739 [Vollenhovia emeryi]|uniref:uncharacterized protein LOC105556739 n=1 Tax=Vollenhovia emeryi TaxID=411798 RepID=UPI0005F369F7|nr:PREDICTED: uncharacterized protein LOC105556739 [Vollenhovia emeryi]
MKINYNHLPVKVHYFFFMATMGAITLHVPVYGRQLGISPLIMGSIIALLPIANLIGKLIVGYAADYFLAWRKRIFMTQFTVTTMSFILMYFLPALPGPILHDHTFQNVSCESLPPCDMDYVSFRIVVTVNFLDEAIITDFLVKNLIPTKSNIHYVPINVYIY